MNFQISLYNKKEAFLETINKLPKKRKEVYLTIHQYKNCTLEKIARILKCRPSDISGRVTELKKCFLIKEKEILNSQRTGNSITSYIILNEDERIDLVNKHYVLLRDEKDKIIKDINEYDNLSEESKKVLLLRVDKINKEIKALKKVI
jgi:hypothetical protein